MLTYGDVPLCFPDPEGELSKWLCKHQPLDEMAAFGRTAISEVSPRRGLQNWHGVRKGIGLTVGNYLAAPPPRLNTLYWPTGATRWARGFFLASGDAKRKIVEKAHGTGADTALTLKMGETGSVIETKLYLLPPRPVAMPDNSSEQLWILPLVDERYWWHFDNVANLEVSSSTTWSTLFTSLGNVIGTAISLPTAVASAYLQPDPFDFRRRYENPAVLLDAAALSCGKRIVRRLDGTIRAESTADASTVHSSNLDLPWQRICGGDFSGESGDRPASVITTFRKWRHYSILEATQLYAETHNATGDKSKISGREKIIHSSLFANCNSSDSTPSNTSELNALAVAIGTDFYAWLDQRHDFTFAGIKAWTPSGFDNSVLWTFGEQGPHGYRSQTRVQSMPPDFGFDLQLSQASSFDLFEPMMIGKADSAISKGSSGTISVWTGRSGSRSDSGKNVTAWATGADIETDIWLGINWVENDWEVFPLECSDAESPY